MFLIFDEINILLLLAVGLNLLLLAVVFFNGRKNKINLTYSAIGLAVIVWIWGMIFYRSAPVESSLLWGTILYINATFIPSIFLYFTYIFPRREEKLTWLIPAIIFGLNGLIVLLTSWPGLIIQAVNLRPGLEKEIIFTPYYWFYFIYISSLFTFGFYRLFQKYRQSRGIARQQILYVLLGDAIAANGAFVTNLIMPWLGYFFLNWLGQLLTVVMVGMATYAIVRYRLMDIRMVARRIFIYFGVATFAYAIFYLLIWFYQLAFGGVFTIGALAFGLILAPLFAVGFYWVDHLMRLLANKYFFVSLYNYQETINRLIDELTNYIDLDKIVVLIVDTIKQVMQLDRAGVLLINTETSPTQYQIAKVIGFNERNGISLVQDNFLTKYLLKIQKPLVREELGVLAKESFSVREKIGFQKLHDHMEHIEASLCLPLISNKKLIGIIVLGSKISGDAYTNEDLGLLNTLSKQASIAINNARQYRQIQNFGQTLQSRVDEQTKDLQAQAEHLKKLLRMRSEFLDIASHQLKTPISVISGTISMFREGLIQTLSKEEQNKFIDNIYWKAKKLNQIISDILQASEIDSEKLSFVPERIRTLGVVELVSQLVEEYLPQAKAKGLQLNLVKPKKKISPILSDEEFLRQALSNLIDNAIKYTKDGQVDILLDETAGRVMIKIKDTGIGIPADDQGRMFGKFERAGNAKNMYTDGSGLGLFITKQIIEAHQDGTISFVSQEGRGSEFVISLAVCQPAKQSKNN